MAAAVKIEPPTLLAVGCKWFVFPTVPARQRTLSLVRKRSWILAANFSRSVSEILCRAMMGSL